MYISLYPSHLPIYGTLKYKFPIILVTSNLSVLSSYFYILYIYKPSP
jgi:hypothetical protein